MFISLVLFGYLKIRYSMFQLLASDIARITKNNKQLLQRVSWDLYYFQKTQYTFSMYQLVQLFQTICFTPFGSSICQGSLS